MTQDKMRLRKKAYLELMEGYSQGLSVYASIQNSHSFKMLGKDDRTLVYRIFEAQIKEEKQNEFEVTNSDDVEYAQ